MSDLIKTYMVRKPSDLDEVLSITKGVSIGRLTEVEITETIELTEQEYRRFCNNPVGERYTYLAGKGGYKDGIQQVVALTCKNKQMLLVDPSGSDYGRYVGIIY